MDMDRQRGFSAHPRHQIGKEQQGGGEMAIGDIDMQNIGVWRDARQILLQPQQVG